MRISSAISVAQRYERADVSPTPDDLNATRGAGAGARHRGDACSPSGRREMLVWIGDAKKPETRARRIARAVAHVMDGT